MSTAAAHQLESRTGLAWWEGEIERLLDTAPELPRAARSAVRRALRALLDEPETGAAAAHDIVALLEFVADEPSRGC